MEYIKDGIHADGAEGWYTAGIQIDLTDYDSFLKHTFNNLKWWMTEDKLLAEKTPFPNVQYKLKNNSLNTTIITEEKQ